WERLQQAHPGVPLRRRTVRIPEQCAVLIGGYRDFDAASADLKRVKNLPLPELKLESGKLAYDTISVFIPDEEKKRTAVPRAPLNPVANSFVTRNPTIPAPPRANKFDPFWKELNAEEEYSLLKCPRPWTLAVKEYRGSAVIQERSSSSNFLKMLG